MKENFVKLTLYQSEEEVFVNLANVAYFVDKQEAYLVYFNTPDLSSTGRLQSVTVSENPLEVWEKTHNR